MADDELRADLANSTDPTKGAALVGYRLPELSAVGRDVGRKLQEHVSVLDFGAIGDGVSRPLSSVFSSLAAAQAVYPHAEALTDELDWAATQAAINLSIDRGGLDISFPGSSSVYVVGENQIQFGSDATNTRLRGEGGKLLFRRYGLDTNLFRAVRPNGVEIHDFTIEGGQLGLSGNPATGGQGFSFTNTKNCRAERLHFIDTRGFNVLWYADTGHADAPLYFNNHIIDCTSDGAEVASSAFLMADLSNSSMVRPYAKNQTGSTDETAYTFNLKGNCIDCSIIDFRADNCSIAVVLSDQGQSTPGSGCKNTYITGAARNCGTAFSSNAANGTYANIVVDTCGVGTSGRAVSIAGFNTKCTYELTIKDLPSTATAIYCRSPDQQFNVLRYDNSGTYLFANDSSAARNEINIAGGPNRTSGLTNIQAKINSVSETVFPRVLDLRDLPYPAWNDGGSRWDSSLLFPLPGGSRTANYLMVRSTGDILFQTQASPRLQFRNTLSTWKINGGLPEFADDAAAQSGGLEIGCLYRTGSVIKIRAA